jgi:hypothetical protein
MIAFWLAYGTTGAVFTLWWTIYLHVYRKPTDMQLPPDLPQRFHWSMRLGMLLGAGLGILLTAALWPWFLWKLWSSPRKP